jgi:hypothetical protein
MTHSYRLWYGLKSTTHLGLEPLDFGKCAKITIFRKNSELKFASLPYQEMMGAVDAPTFPKPIMTQ